LPPGWSLVHCDSEKFVGHLAVAIAPSEESAVLGRGELRERKIGHDVHYPILDSDQTAWRDSGRIAGTLEVSRELTKRITSLPCFAELTADELDQVLDALRAIR
jgi:dTDP-3-amino-2,3,6-trideoxy-4-keto-D-glucose/dTDP-3-amino-3,4,6-trideoxy-alpha-D-glucose/dTDP-2,6-dideoxy-D-kanosamine transaminase